MLFDFTFIGCNNPLPEQKVISLRKLDNKFHAKWDTTTATLAANKPPPPPRRKHSRQINVRNFRPKKRILNLQDEENLRAHSLLKRFFFNLQAKQQQQQYEKKYE